MDNGTHALLGAAGGIVIGEITGDSLWVLALCGALAAQLPDLDTLGSRGDDVYYMKHHRVASHALLLMPLGAAAFSILASLLTDISLAVLFATGLTALVLHILTDILNAYGTCVFWPFSRKRYAGDILPICDVYLLVILGAGVFGSLFWRAQCIYWAWNLSVLYVLLRVFLRQKAGKLAYKQLPEDIWRVVILPKVSLLHWSYIALSDEYYYLGQVHLNRKRLIILGKYSRPLVEEWEDSKRMRAFIEFSRFPYCYDYEDAKEWMDMRYGLYKNSSGPLQRKKK